MTDNVKAAAILRQYAGELYQGHTIGGEWDGEHIKAEHDELVALADRLAQGAPERVAELLTAYRTTYNRDDWERITEGFTRNDRVPAGAILAIDALCDLVEQMALADAGGAVAWFRFASDGFIRNDDGYAIGTDEPSIEYGARPKGHGWQPLYTHPTPRTDSGRVATEAVAQGGMADIIERMAAHMENYSNEPPIPWGLKGFRLINEARALLASAPAVPVGMALVPCDEATAASVWLTTCASNIEAGFSQWECDEMRRIAALLAAAPTPATVATEAVAQNARDAAFIDVVTHGQGFLQIGADGMETHIPAESVVHEAVAQGGGVDVEKVMALVEQYGQEKWSQGDNQYRRGCESSATYYSEEAGRIRDRIRALLASAPAVPVGDGCLLGDVMAQMNGYTQREASYTPAPSADGEG